VRSARFPCPILVPFLPGDHECKNEIFAQGGERSEPHMQQAKILGPNLTLAPNLNLLRFLRARVRLGTRAKITD